MAPDGGTGGGTELFSFELCGILEFIRFLLGLFSGSSLPPQTPSEPCKTQGFLVDISSDGCVQMLIQSHEPNSCSPLPGHLGRGVESRGAALGVMWI